MLADPTKLREALESVRLLSEAGVAFVAIPAMDEDDLKALREESIRRCELMLEAAEFMQDNLIKE